MQTSTTMMMKDKSAAVFAASGAIAGAVARRLAREGAVVFVSARNLEAAEDLAADIRRVGGLAEAARVDATVDAEVGDWLSSVDVKGKGLDIVFNGIGGTPRSLFYPASSLDQPLADFLFPIDRIAGSQFLTARHAARLMRPRKSGAIVMLSATLSGMTASHMAGISSACGAIEALTRALAGELGPDGIRVNCVRGSGMPETRTIQETVTALVALGAAPAMAVPPLGRPIEVDETAKAAVFLASDGASGMMGQIVTVCGGAFVG